MQKKDIFYIIAIAVLCVVVWFLLVSGSAREGAAPADTTTNTESTPSAADNPEAEATPDSSLPAPEDTETITIEGVFVGLEDSPLRDRQMHQFMLINDGTEIIRISLKPLLGNQNTAVEETLGVNRGDPVRVEGTLAEGVFTVSSVTTVSQ